MELEGLEFKCVGVEGKEYNVRGGSSANVTRRIVACEITMIDASSSSGKRNKHALAL
jgi:hypothetical protein